MSDIYCSVADLAERFEVSRVTIWRWVKKNGFPAPRHFSPGCTRWSNAEVEKWVVERRK